MADTPRARGGRPTRRIGLTARGWCLAVLGIASVVGGLWAGYPGLVALGLGSVVATAAAVGGLLSASRLEVARVVPARTVPRLSPLEVSLRVHNPSPQVARAFRAAEHVAGKARSLDLVSLEPGATTDVSFSVDTTYPGPVVLGPFVLRQLGFAGLAALRWSDGAQEELTVLARTLPVSLPTSGARPLELMQPDRVEGGGTELRSLRPYVAGDDLRKVNAFVSARAGTLMIRQDAEPSVLALGVLVDNATALDDDTYAEVLDVAASLCAAAAGDGLEGRWGGRSMPSTEPVDAGCLKAAVVGQARLGRTDEDLPRTTDGDLTVVVTGSGTDQEALVRSVAAHGDHRMLGVLVVDPTSTAEGGGGSGAVVRLVGPRAEDLLRSFSRLDRMLAGAR